MAVAIAIDPNGVDVGELALKWSADDAKVLTKARGNTTFRVMATEARVSMQTIRRMMRIKSASEFGFGEVNIAKVGITFNLPGVMDKLHQLAITHPDKAARLWRGLTQEEVASRVEANCSTYAAVERREWPAAEPLRGRLDYLWANLPPITPSRRMTVLPGGLLSTTTAATRVGDPAELGRLITHLIIDATLMEMKESGRRDAAEIARSWACSAGNEAANRLEAAIREFFESGVIADGATDRMLNIIHELAQQE